MRTHDFGRSDVLRTVPRHLDAGLSHAQGQAQPA